MNHRFTVQVSGFGEFGDFHLVVQPRGGEKLVSRAPDCTRHRIVEGDVQVLDCLDRASNVSRNDGEELGGVAGVGSLLLVGLEKTVWCLGFGICGVGFHWSGPRSKRTRLEGGQNISNWSNISPLG